MTTRLLGVVADDVTGACDVADAVCAAGLSAVVLIGVPELPLPPSDCVVAALKSRTAPVATAVAESTAAARALLSAGGQLLYQKYCSTFDSTDRGNIGPVADALCDLLDESGRALSVGTPATPRVGRTVYQGHLFVGRQLLSDSPLRDHPLTPMRDPDLVAVLGRQTPHRVDVVPRAVVAAGVDAVATALADAHIHGVRHVLLDALDDTDLDVAAAALHRLAEDGIPLLAAGAAGFAGALARRVSSTPGLRSSFAVAAPAGRRLIVSGSCSHRTRGQVAAFPGPCIRLLPVELADDFAGTVDRVLAEVAAAFRDGDGPVLVSSSAAPAQVGDAAARLGSGRPAQLLEAASAEIARRAVGELGVRRLLVAGGETSGAVLHALGVRALRVGPAVAPGVPWMVTADRAPLAFLLKSGNFGAADLFTTAWAACP